MIYWEDGTPIPNNDPGPGYEMPDMSVLTIQTKRCSLCGKVILATATVCPHCRKEREAREDFQRQAYLDGGLRIVLIAGLLGFLLLLGFVLRLAWFGASGN